MHPGDAIFYAQVPVIKHLAKKNSRVIMKRGGRVILGKTAALLKAERDMLWQLGGQKRAIKLQYPIDFPVRCVFKFHCTNLLTRDKKTKRLRLSETIGDLSNLYQLPEDCLEEAGILAGDHLIMSHDGSRKIQSTQNMLEIFVLKFDEPYGVEP